MKHLIYLILFISACGSSHTHEEPMVTLRVLAAGDSITYGAGGHYFGYRGFLADLAGAAGMQLSFVGSQTENLGVGTGHEGRPGWRSDELLAAIGPWITTQQPDVILLHIGTNDIYQDLPVENAVSSIDDLLELCHQTRPAAWILIATPGPFRSPKNAKAQELSNQIRQMVSKKIERIPKIILADTHAALASSVAGLPALFDDSAHPSDLGYYLMARVWLDSIKKTQKP